MYLFLKYWVDLTATNDHLTICHQNVLMENQMLALCMHEEEAEYFRFETWAFTQK